MNYLQIIKSIGDWISSAVPTVINWFSGLGSGKFLTLIILGLVLYFSLKVVNKLLKIVLIIASIIFILTVGASWFLGIIK